MNAAIGDLVAITPVTLAPAQTPTMVLRKNMTYQLQIDTNAESLVYVSSNPNIVLVNPNTGLLTGKGVGVAVILVKDQNTGYSASIVVNCIN